MSSASSGSPQHPLGDAEQPWGHHVDQLGQRTFITRGESFAEATLPFQREVPSGPASP